MYGYKDGIAAIDLPIMSPDPPITPLSSSKLVIDIEFDSKNQSLFVIQGHPDANVSKIMAYQFSVNVIVLLCSTNFTSLSSAKLVIDIELDSQNQSLFVMQGHLDANVSKIMAYQL